MQPFKFKEVADRISPMEKPMTGEQYFELRKQIAALDAKLETVLLITSGIAGNSSEFDTEAVSQQWLQICRDIYRRNLAELENPSEKETAD